MAEQINELPGMGVSDPEADLEYLISKRDQTIEKLAKLLKNQKVSDKREKAKREEELFKIILRQNRQIDLFIESNKP